MQACKHTKIDSDIVQARHWSCLRGLLPQPAPLLPPLHLATGTGFRARLSAMHDDQPQPAASLTAGPGGPRPLPNGHSHGSGHGHGHDRSQQQPHVHGNGHSHSHSHGQQGGRHSSAFTAASREQPGHCPLSPLSPRSPRHAHGEHAGGRRTKLAFRGGQGRSARRWHLVRRPAPHTPQAGMFVQCARHCACCAQAEMHILLHLVACSCLRPLQSRLVDAAQISVVGLVNACPSTDAQLRCAILVERILISMLFDHRCSSCTTRRSRR